MNIMDTTCGILCWDFFCLVQVGVFLDAHFDEVDMGEWRFLVIFFGCTMSQAEMHAPSGTITTGGKPPQAPCCDCDHSGAAWNTSSRRHLNATCLQSQRKYSMED